MRLPPDPARALAEATNWDDSDGSNCHAVAVLRPDQLPAMQPGWNPIDTAPKDGGHFLACVEPPGGFNEHRGFDQYPPSVVHWFGYGAPGFYLSTSVTEQTKPYEYTHWRPIPRWLEPSHVCMAWGANSFCAICGKDMPVSTGTEELSEPHPNCPNAFICAGRCGNRCAEVMGPA